MDAVIGLIDATRGWLFEQAVLPVLYGLGLMALAEPAYESLDVVMLGVGQMAIAFALFRPLERWRPVEAWRDRRAVRVDVLYTVLERLGVISLLFFFTLRPLVDGLDGVARRAGYIPPNLEDMLPAGVGGHIAAFAVYLLVLDLADYLYHRLQHRWDTWWALHSVHHSQRQLSFWADDRNHVLDSLLREAVLATLALLIGVPGRQFVLIVFVTKLVESLSHANVQFSFGPLGERLLVSPHYHRIHHGIGVGHEGPARGCNFAALFPVWDILFGTARFLPIYPPTGIRGDTLVDYGSGFWDQQFKALGRLGRVWRPAGLEPSGRPS